MNQNEVSRTSVARRITFFFFAVLLVLGGGCEQCSKKDKKSALDGSYCKKMFGSDPTALKNCEEKNEMFMKKFCNNEIESVQREDMDEDFCKKVEGASQ